MNRLAIIMIMISTLFYGYSKGQISTARISWEPIIKRKSLETLETSMTAKIIPGWNIYALNNSLQSPVKVSFKFLPDRSYQLEGQASLRSFEKLLGMPVPYPEDDIEHKQKIRLKGKDGIIRGTLQLMQCSDQTYVPSQEFGIALKIFK